MDKILLYVDKIGKLIIRFKKELILVAMVIFLIFSMKALSKKDGSFIIYVAITVGLAVWYLVTKGLLSF